MCIFQETAQFKFTTNIIRWRYKRDNLGGLELGEDGQPLRETNSRLVKWSDGSTQLLVGDEAFDVEEQSIDRRVGWEREGIWYIGCMDWSCGMIWDRVE